MAELHVVSQLKTKYSEVKGDIEQLEVLIKEKKSDIVAIERSIKLFDPDSSLEGLKPIRKMRPMVFRSGELKRMILDVLKKKGTADYAELESELKQRKRTEAKILSSIHTTVRRLISEGILIEEPTGAGGKRFKIKPLGSRD